MDPSSAPPGVDRIESLSSGELSRSVSHEDTLNLVTPRTQEAFADAIRNVSAEELAMLETPRRGRAYAPLNYHLDPPPSPSVSEARFGFNRSYSTISLLASVLQAAKATAYPSV